MTKHEKLLTRGSESMTRVLLTGLIAAFVLATAPGCKKAEEKTTAPAGTEKVEEKPATPATPPAATPPAATPPSAAAPKPGEPAAPTPNAPAQPTPAPDQVQT